MIGPFHFICLACQQEASKQAKTLTKYYMGELYTMEYGLIEMLRILNEYSGKKHFFCDA